MILVLLLAISNPQGSPTPEYCWEIREIAIEAGMDPVKVQQLFTRCRKHK